MQINEIGLGSEVNLAGILDFYVAWKSKLSQGGLVYYRQNFSPVLLKNQRNQPKLKFENNKASGKKT